MRVCVCLVFLIGQATSVQIYMLCLSEIRRERATEKKSKRERDREKERTG